MPINPTPTSTRRSGEPCRVPATTSAPPRTATAVAAAASGRRTGRVDCEDRFLPDTHDPRSATTTPAANGARPAAPGDAKAARAGAARAVGGLEPEDLSARLQTMWMADSGDEIQRAYIADMANLASRYGFTVVIQMDPRGSELELTQDLLDRTGLSWSTLRPHLRVVPAGYDLSAWGEDNKILTRPSSQRARPTVLVAPKLADSTLERAELFTRIEGYHPYLAGFQGAVTSRGDSADAAAIANAVRWPPRLTASYLEGGNVCSGTNAQGEPYAIIGRDSIVITAIHLLDSDRFTIDGLDAKVAQLDADSLLAADLVAQTQQQLAVAYQGSVSTLWARRFLAALEISRDVIAADLGVDRRHAVFVTQPDFHIDMHVRPMGPGRVLLNDPATCVRTLQAALSDPSLPRWEAKPLRGMVQQAQWEAAMLGPVYREIEAQLTAAGLRVQRAPGVFASGIRHANFMNGVPGTLPDGSTFYFCNGSSISSLQNAASRFFRDTVGVDRIEFVGNAGGGPESLSAGEVSLSWSGALDCREVHSSAPYDGDDLLRRFDRAAA